MKEIILRVDINVVTAFLLMVVWVNAVRRLDRRDRINKIFLTISMITIAELIIETITCVINHRRELILIPIAKVMHVCLFSMAPLITYLWCVFVEEWVNNKKFISLKLKLLSAPIIVNAIVTISSYFNGVIFHITSNNVYQRGAFFFLSVGICYIYLIYGLIYILVNMKKIQKDEVVILMLFGILPAIAGMVQALVYGVLLMWSSAAVSLIIVFLYLHQRMTQIDTVTGAWTRNAFDVYIENRISKRNKDVGFSIVFMDLDKFKQINDNYGHFEGDIALKNAVCLIQDSFGDKDIIARFGGDEFVILTSELNKEKLEDVLSEMNKNFKEYNRVSCKPYKIEYSIGYDVFNYKDYENMGQFLNYVDGLMYKNKESKK